VFLQSVTTIRITAAIIVCRTGAAGEEHMRRGEHPSTTGHSRPIDV